MIANIKRPRLEDYIGVSHQRILIPILNQNLAEDLVELAQIIVGLRSEQARQTTSRVQIVVLGVVQVPEDTPLSEGASLVKAYRTMLRYLPPENDARVEIRTEVRVARQVWQGIVEQVAEDESDLLLLHWKGFTNTAGKVYGATIDELMHNPPCDIALARFNNLPAPQKHILLPVRGGSYSALALRFATNLVRSWHADLTVLHSREASSNRDNADSINSLDEVESNLMQSLDGELPSGTRIVTVYGSPALRKIAAEAVTHDMVIMGAGVLDEDSLRSTVPIDVQLARETNRPMLVVKTRRPLEVFSPVLDVTTPKTTLTEQVDRWFAENIFNYREFRTMSSLTLLKERNNLSISLIFPVYGPPPTSLSNVVRRARYALVHDCALADEIIVSVDSLATDSTEFKFWQRGFESNRDAIAAESEDLIFVGPTTEQLTHSRRDGELVTGPAEALRAALSQARGDIIVWADPTIPNFEARLVYGLVGPLLNNPTLQIATGFYSSADSGQVESPDLYFCDDLTELTLRPLIGAFFPPLAGIFNPLCSVGAARRDLLEHLPLFTGQALNFGLLLDTFLRQSLMAIAQVNLGTPPNFTRPIEARHLTGQVLNVMLHRLEDRSQNTLLRLLDPTIKTIHKKSGSNYSFQADPPAEIVRELSPLIYNPDYVRRTF